MKNWVTRILTVQKLDMRMHNLEVKYRTIPVEKARLVEEFNEAQQLLAAAQAKVREVEKKLKEGEAESETLEEKIKKLQIQSTSVKKNDEYQAILKEISSVQGQIEDLDIRQLTLMDELDEAKKAVPEAEAACKAAERTAKSEMEELNALAAQIKEEALKVKKERRDFSSLCEKAVLEAYMHIREKDRSRPSVVPVKDGSCSGCSLKTPPQTANEAKKGLLTFCDNCGCILYDSDCPSDYQS